MGMSEDVKRYVSNHLKNDASEFAAYIEDIATNRAVQPPLGQATPLGAFTWARALQLVILQKTSMILKQTWGPSSNTRSLGGVFDKELDSTIDTQEEEPDDTTDIQEEELDSTTDTQEDIEMDDSDPSEVTNIEEYDLGTLMEETMTNFSDGSLILPDRTSYREGVDIVKVSLMALLSALTLTCERARLNWDVKKKRLDCNLGHAKIRSINDGCLRDRKTGNVLAVVEANPFLLFANPEQTLMQMGLEMLAHIVDCVQNGRPKKRYLLFSEHLNEIYLTWALFTISLARMEQTRGRANFLS
ncbi:hypothetical protein BO94DRAFT_610072 [Aspergillus sclerotioniger CBS 115572]|uniref:Uncharacterized protein n=1 Tax=Aspergillus sclerotioniger CBS 115572 TaxID=1450535 RepID=A0A317XAN2_9EURO|nr:hypothetical protein BO94DRAFT_610072 [Aspergillus sclerotioniger CBS 115572]PWY94627.1 hypothetical protein BO94DRAFT_610072 [Aspergillus sclerotioniger CBS 115572]